MTIHYQAMARWKTRFLKTAYFRKEQLNFEDNELKNILEKRVDSLLSRSDVYPESS